MEWGVLPCPTTPRRSIPVDPAKEELHFSIARTMYMAVVEFGLQFWNEKEKDAEQSSEVRLEIAPHGGMAGKAGCAEQLGTWRHHYLVVLSCKCHLKLFSLQQMIPSPGLLKDVPLQSVPAGRSRSPFSTCGKRCRWLSAQVLNVCRADRT
eukprot:3098385-Amphidinium_carterae.1